MRDFQTQIQDYVCSAHAMLAVLTPEKDRVIHEIRQAAEKIDREVIEWSVATGFRDSEGESQGGPQCTKPDCALEHVVKFEEKTIIVFKDFDFYLHVETFPQCDVVIGWLEELKQHLSNNKKTLIFVGPEVQVPPILRHDITVMDFALPDDRQIAKHIEFIAGGVEIPGQAKKGIKVDPELMPLLVRACKGMTQQEILDRTSLAVRIHRTFNMEAAKTIIRAKAGVIGSTGLLGYEEPPEGGLSIVGGLANLKAHLARAKARFADAARKFGCRWPRGIAAIGVPGCGKSLLARQVAGFFCSPLLTLDVGALMDKYVGQSEANAREAIRIIESIGDCVLMIDEIEKGFGDGDLDGGSSKRVFGTFLKWLSDRKSHVFVVATANDVTSLPPETFRSGRFDKVFFVDLPNAEERAEIIAIHLKLKGRDPNNFDVPEIVKATENFTGSDIEQAVEEGLVTAFMAESQLATEHVIEGAKSVVPLFKTEPERVTEIRDWCSKRAEPANVKPVGLKAGRRAVQVTA